MCTSHRDEFLEGNTEEERVCEGRGRTSEKERSHSFSLLCLLQRILLYIFSSLAHAVPHSDFYRSALSCQRLVSVCVCADADVFLRGRFSWSGHLYLHGHSDVEGKRVEIFFCAFLFFDALTLTFVS